MKIMLAIIGGFFLLLAALAGWVAIALAFAPVLAMLLFLVLGLWLIGAAIADDRKKQKPVPPPQPAISKN